MKLRLKDIREDHNITQNKIASYLNIKQNTYSQYENEIRQLPMEALVKLALFYNTSTDYLLGLTDIMEPYPHCEDIIK